MFCAFKDDTEALRLNLAQRSNVAVVPVGLSKAFGSVCYNICADCEISRERARLANAV